MASIKIIRNSEKYIKMFEDNHTITIPITDIQPSTYLLKVSDPLWGFYDMTSFKVNEIEVSSKEIFPNDQIICGDFFGGAGLIGNQGFVKKIDKIKFFQGIK